MPQVSRTRRTAGRGLITVTSARSRIALAMAPIPVESRNETSPMSNTIRPCSTAAPMASSSAARATRSISPARTMRTCPSSRNASTRNAGVEPSVDIELPVIHRVGIRHGMVASAVDEAVVERLGQVVVLPSGEPRTVTQKLRDIGQGRVTAEPRIREPHGLDRPAQLVPGLFDVLELVHDHARLRADGP